MKFSKYFHITVLVPVLIIVLGLVVGIVSGGMNLGIDFTGGTMMTIHIGEDFDSHVVSQAFIDQGFSDQQISVTVSGSGADAEALVRFPDTNDADRENEIRANVETDIRETYPQAEVASSERVGAVAGRDLIWNAVSSVALLLDVGVMISMVTILRLQVNSSFIAAILTIVGYAINDTIVVFDRVRENLRVITRKEMNRAALADLSVKETLPRTINTTVTTLITIVTLYIMGVSSIKEFALPIIIGLVAGNFTSIFIAPSLWGLWQDRIDEKRAAGRRAGKVKPKKA